MSLPFAINIDPAQTTTANRKSYSDTEFISCVLAGGAELEKALAWKMAKLKGYVYNFSKSTSITNEEAEICFVDAFMGMIRMIKEGRFNATCKISTLLFKIMSNKAIDLARKKARFNQHVGFPETLPEVTDPALTPERWVISKERKEGLIESMQQLPERYRNVLMDWASGYSMEEIATRHGFLNANTAKSTKRVGMVKLIKIIRGKGIDLSA